MASQQIEVIRKELHPQAEDLVRQRTNEFATSLLLQAKTLAYQRRDDVVLSNHVEEALDIIRKRRDPGRLREFVIIMGGALFGAFVQGFITELSSGRPLLVAIYVVLGFLGMGLIFLGLLQGL